MHSSKRASFVPVGASSCELGSDTREPAAPRSTPTCRQQHDGCHGRHGPRRARKGCCRQRRGRRRWLVRGDALLLRLSGCCVGVLLLRLSGCCVGVVLLRLSGWCAGKSFDSQLPKVLGSQRQLGESSAHAQQQRAGVVKTKHLRSFRWRGCMKDARTAGGRHFNGMHTHTRTCTHHHRRSS